MAKKPKHVVCVDCRLGQEQTLKQTFLGFFRFTCRDCEVVSTYPLSMGYRVIYGLAILSFVGLFVNGTAPCGILGVGGIIALAYDFGIRRRANEAIANERSAGEVFAETFK